MTRHYLEPAREIEVIDDVDVCAVGGGPAGVCAAVDAPSTSIGKSANEVTMML